MYLSVALTGASGMMHQLLIVCPERHGVYRSAPRSDSIRRSRGRIRGRSTMALSDPPSNRSQPYVAKPLLRHLLPARQTCTSCQSDPVSVRHTPRQLDFEAILRPSRWASGMQVIGAIPEYVVSNLGLATTSRSVWLHEQTVASICDSRGLRTEDSEFVFEYMPAAVFRPMFFGVEERGGAVRISLVELIRGEGRYLYIGVKVTRSRSGDDELWVSTGYPISDETLRRYLRSGRLRGVVGRRLEGGKTRTARRVPRGLATQMP